MVCFHLFSTLRLVEFSSLKVFGVSFNITWDHKPKHCIWSVFQYYIGSQVKRVLLTLSPHIYNAKLLLYRHFVLPLIFEVHVRV